MTKTRALQLQARKAEHKFISLGRFIVLGTTGEFCPVWGGVEALGVSSMIQNNAAGWRRNKRDRRFNLMAARNRRRTLATRLLRAYLP